MALAIRAHDQIEVDNGLSIMGQLLEQYIHTDAAKGRLQGSNVGVDLASKCLDVFGVHVQSNGGIRLLPCTLHTLQLDLIELRI